jgi:prophage tail gpP-like protein
MDDRMYQVFIDNVLWQGWNSIEIHRSIEQMSGSFALTLAHAYILDVKPHQSCIIQVDGQTIVSGFIDRVDMQYSVQGTFLNVQGRDRTADLIDCAATIDGPYEFVNQTLDQVVKAIVAPFGIEVTVNAPVGETFKRIAIQPGETAYDLIERLCRYRNILPLSNGIGGLSLVEAGQARLKSQLIYGQNILSARITQDYSARYSHVSVKGQSESFDQSSSADITTPSGLAIDRSITRYRPKLIIAENQGNDTDFKGRAAWDIAFAKARSINAQYQVQGWYAGINELWLPNRLVYVNDPQHGIDQDLLIVSVQHQYSETGSLTTLQLTQEDAFLSKDTA